MAVPIGSIYNIAEGLEEIMDDEGGVPPEKAATMMTGLTESMLLGILPAMMFTMFIAIITKGMSVDFKSDARSIK